MTNSPATTDININPNARAMPKQTVHQHTTNQIYDYFYHQWVIGRELGNYKSAIFGAAKPELAFTTIANQFGLETFQIADNYAIGTSSTVYIIQSGHSLNVTYREDQQRAMNRTIANTEPHDPKTFVKWFYHTDRGIASSTMPLTGPSPHDAFYPWLPSSLEDFAEDFVASSANVLLLIGPPGTGKTSFIRGLCRYMGYETWVTYDQNVQEDERFYVSFSSIEADGANEVFDLVRARASTYQDQPIAGNTNISDIKRLSRGDGRVLVLEDADTMLGARRDGNLLMNRLLNLSDGLISLPARKIIFSTNLPGLQSVDEALLRPGRCYGAIKFRELTVAEALKAQEAAGKSVPINKKTVTLSEALNGSRDDQHSVHKIGF